MRTTTLNLIRAKGPCGDGWQRLLKGLNKTEADDEPLSFLDILRINGVADCLWAARCDPSPDADRFWRLLACDVAERCQPKDADPRSLEAIAVSRRFANGEATADELSAARIAAESAAWCAARSAAWCAAWCAAWSAAESAAASAAESAAESAARIAAASAERQWQTERVREALESEL